MTPPAVHRLATERPGLASPFDAIHERLDDHDRALARLESRAGALPTTKVLTAVVAIVSAVAPLLPDAARGIANLFVSIFGG